MNESQREIKEREKIENYVSTAIFFTADVEQLISMAILHFDIPDKKAKEIVTNYIKKYNPSLLGGNH